MKLLARRVHYVDNEPYLNNGDVPVRAVLSLLDKKNGERRVAEKYPFLTDLDIRNCKLLALVELEDRPEYKRNKHVKARRSGKPRQPLKIMFDENLTYKIVPALVNNISEVSHVYFEDMQAWRDIDIWNKVKGCDRRGIVITRDRDFVELAEIFTMEAIVKAGAVDKADISAEPFVVHIDTKVTKKVDVLSAFRKQAHMMAKEAQREPREMPYMTLKGDRIVSGASVRDIFRKYMLPRTDMPDDYRSLIAAIDWRRLNRVRQDNGLPGISSYALQAPEAA